MSNLATNEFECSEGDPSAANPAKSRCKTLDQSEVLYLNPAHSVAFRHWFAPVFAKWLQGNFQNPEHVAFAFGVRNSTAWNWWNGDNRASGDAVVRVFMAFPQAAVWFREQWAAR